MKSAEEANRMLEHDGLAPALLSTQPEAAQKPIESDSSFLLVPPNPGPARRDGDDQHDGHTPVYPPIVVVVAATLAPRDWPSRL